MFLPRSGVAGLTASLLFVSAHPVAFNRDQVRYAQRGLNAALVAPARVLVQSLSGLHSRPAGAAPIRRVPRPLVSRLIMAMTMRVHVCEEGGHGWRVDGPTYFGGLGWLWSTWQAFRSPAFPANMADASPQQQAWAMAHFATAYGWPDQRGCTGSY